MDYYISISIIFLLVFIILLSIFYSLLISKNSSLKSRYDSCPEKWVVDETSGYCKIPASELNGSVYGNVLIDNGYKQKGIPYQSIGQYGKVINFNDASWFSYYSTSSSECAWKKWATHNNVVWSGITNVSIPDC